MPIDRRTSRGSTRGSEISRPSNSIIPSSMSSSRSRQRSSVDFPEPDEPIRQTTSPVATVSDDVVEHHAVAVRLAQAAHLDDRRSAGGS